MDVVRSCYAADFNLPAVGVVRGYYYFSTPGTPFFPGLTWLGSANWHRGDGTPWPAYGETESGSRKWRNGRFAGDKPPEAKRLGPEGCMESATPALVPLTWRWNMPRECFLVEDESMPAGAIVMYGASGPVPLGWLECDGRDVSRTYYGELFSAIGTTWGAGDGVNTFTLPDMRSRLPIGAGSGPGLSPRALASIGGEEEVVLSVGQLPAHTHDFIANSLLDTGIAGPGPDLLMANPVGQATTATGNNEGHANMPPWVGVRFIIRVHN